jgi:hypothetical protein
MIALLPHQFWFARNLDLPHREHRLRISRAMRR